MAVQLLQQLAVHVVDVDSPDAQHRVEASRHHQVLGRRVVPGAVHKGRVGENHLGCSQEPLHVPLAGDEG